MTHVGHGAGFVVGQAIHHHCRAADAVAFVAAFFVVDAFQIAGATVDGALDGVFGILASNALSTARRRRGLVLTSAPPILAATVIS